MTEILIGKEPGQGRLMVALKVNGQYRNGMLGDAGSVPASVSRCKPAEGTAHCRLDISDDGSMKLTNLKEQNVTFVNGLQVISKRIAPDSLVQLGSDKYTIDISAVVRVADKLVPASEKVFSIAPLEEVWNRFHDAQLEIRKKQRNIGLVSKAAPIFTMSGVILSAILTLMGLSTVSVVAYIFTAVGLSITIIGFVKSYKDHSLEQSENMMEAFQEEYVCPNPDCHHFVGQQPYKVLRKTRICPYCHCKWTD